jgi:hypothetical protein
VDIVGPCDTGRGVGESPNQTFCSQIPPAALNLSVCCLVPTLCRRKPQASRSIVGRQGITGSGLYEREPREERPVLGRRDGGRAMLTRVV